MCLYPKNRCSIFREKKTMMRVIVLVLVCSWSSVFAQSAATQPNPVQPNLIQPGADSVSADTTRIAMRQHFGISSSLGLNQRSVGLPEEFRAKYGNEPVIGIGISSMSWGDLLFQTSKLRWGVSLHKLLNTFPNARIFENLQTDIQCGYAVLETPTLKVYPFLGVGTTTIALDSITRIAFLNVNGGVGAEYFLPNSPIVLSLQAAYNHTFNILARGNVPNNEPGLTVRMGCFLYLRSRYNYWGWD